MSRVVLDPNELAALSALCRNASYDVAGIANEARHHMDQVASFAGADAPRLSALIDTATALLLRVSSQLDDDAVHLASVAQRGVAADALSSEDTP